MVASSAGAGAFAPVASSVVCPGLSSRPRARGRGEKRRTAWKETWTEAMRGGDGGAAEGRGGDPEARRARRKRRDTIERRGGMIILR
jgi:hypothetical protein